MSIHQETTDQVNARYKDPPMKSDYEETAALFEDFCIFNVDIPSFKTLAELLQWRKRVIKERLG